MHLKKEFEGRSTIVDYDKSETVLLLPSVILLKLSLSSVDKFMKCYFLIIFNNLKNPYIHINHWVEIRPGSEVRKHVSYSP